MKVRCVVVEEDPELAEQAVQRGMHTVQGDAAQPTILEKAHISTAKVVVVALAESIHAKRVMMNVRSLTKAHVIVRSRSASDEVDIYAKGADEVISEDLEASLLVVDRVLHAYQVSGSSIQVIGKHLRDLQRSAISNAKFG